MSCHEEIRYAWVGDDHPVADVLHLVNDLRGMGFVDVGRLSATNHDDVEIAGLYGEPDRTWYLEHAGDAAPVLRSPDGDAFVELSEFYVSPSIRFRTQLANGGIVETKAQWTRLPIPAEEEYELDRDVIEAQTRGSHPAAGRTIHVVDSTDVRVLWKEHLEQVANVGEARSDHEGQETYLALNRKLFAHELAIVDAGVAWAERMVWGVRLLCIAACMGLVYRELPGFGVALAVLSMVCLEIARFPLLWVGRDIARRNPPHLSTVG